MDTTPTAQAPRPLAYACGWCPDSEARTAELRSQGYDVSHGICRECWPRFRAENGLAPAPYPEGEVR